MDFDAETKIFAEKMQGEQCREDKKKRMESQKTPFSFLSPFSFEKSEKRTVKESRKLFHQQEELKREQSSAFIVEEIQKGENKAVLKRREEPSQK